MKTKVRPEDFIVTEESCLPLGAKGSFGVYLLEKNGWNTLGLLLELSRRLDIPFEYFSYGGRKDRHALTRQYISIRAPRLSELKEKDYSLKFIGFMSRPMGPDLIKGNRFEITVRGLSKTEADKSVEGLGCVNAFGFANYFDDQRFGSYDSRQGFLAEKLLKQQFNGALKIYLTSVRPEDKKTEKEKKLFFFKNWRDWEACRARANTAFEKRAFDFLGRKPGGFLELLKEMPRHELSMHIGCYQACLWNEMLRRIIRAKADGSLKGYKGSVGEYVLYGCLTKEEYPYLNGLQIPVPGAKPEFGDRVVKDIYGQVMEDNGLKQPLFNKMRLRQAFFKSFLRKAIIKPENLAFTFMDDELYPGKRKLCLEFFLPRGSFATMLIKSIFN